MMDKCLNMGAKILPTYVQKAAPHQSKLAKSIQRYQLLEIHLCSSIVQPCVNRIYSIPRHSESKQFTQTYLATFVFPYLFVFVLEYQPQPQNQMKNLILVNLKHQTAWLENEYMSYPIHSSKGGSSSEISKLQFFVCSKDSPVNQSQDRQKSQLHLNNILEKIEEANKAQVIFKLWKHKQCFEIHF